MNATAILKLHEIKKTPGRISIINALQENCKPLSESEIRKEMRENYDRITFYRNIQTLSAAGIIHKIVVDNTCVRYGLNCCEAKHEHHVHRNEHAHFYCEACQNVVCLEQVRIPQFNLPDGYKSMDSDIIIRGKCEKCSGS
jgi:Fur family ferric uptake transcriptional regulator